MAVSVTPDTPTAMRSGNTATSASRWGEWRALPLVIGSGLAMGTSAPLYHYTASLMMPHLVKEFGWTRGEISAAAGLAGLSALTFPLIGRLVDRVGPRPVAFVSTVLLSLILLAMAWMPGSIALFFGLLLAKQVVAGGCNAIPHTRIITRWFHEHRGMALSIAMSIIPLIAAIYVPIYQRVLDSHGWRIGWTFTAATVLIGLPAIVFALREPKAGALAIAATAAAAGKTTGFTPKEGVKKVQFWLIVAAMVLLNIPGGGILLNLSPLMTDSGFTPAQAAVLVSIFPISIIVGRVVCGLMLDHMSPTVAAGIMSVLPGIGYPIFLLGGDLNFALAAFAVGLMGLQQGAEFDLLAFFTARYLGFSSYGFFFGLAFMLYTFALSVGTFTFGAAYDMAGSYAPALMLAAITFPAAALCFFALRWYPHFKSERPN